MSDDQRDDGCSSGAESDPPRARGLGDEVLPAYYARRPGGWRDWWTLLHPPYTAWHLAYVVIGASLAPEVRVSRLVYTLGAFFLAVGVAAHALDELHGRPLRTTIPTPALVGAAAVGLLGALTLGIVGIAQVGWTLVPFLVVGPLLVVAYNVELFGGRLHTDVVFALGWGAFPVLTAYVAQTGTLGLAPVLAASACCGLSVAQRTLSTPARLLRRRASVVEGFVTLDENDRLLVNRRLLLAPLENALRALSWSIVLLATSVAVARIS